jgi:TonB-linked SusC/RagA family outer membrane protein
MKEKRELRCFLMGSMLKFVLKMKLLTYLLFFTALVASAEESYSQATKFSLKLKNVSVLDIFNHIEENSEFILLYNEKWVNVNRRIDINAKNETVEELLDQVFHGTNNVYKIYDRQIVLLKDKNDVVPLPIQNGIESPSTIEQQIGIVRGKVTDPDGLPLPGATITIEGTTKGVITDVDGTYSIEAKSSDKLIFSFVGMESQIIVVKEQRIIDVQLGEKVDELEEVTIVAFGKQKKESVIGAITTVKPAELKVPSSNLTTALAGRMSGVISYQRSGEPGLDNADFFIRGVTTFGYKVDPLILIDNMEVSTTDLARLQIDDIASFSIMKDATATALYGARGANGVILITTKQGKEGSAKLDFRYETSLSRPTQNVELADPVTYMKLHNEAVLTRDALGVLPYSNEKIANTENGTNSYLYPATDWRDLLMKDFTLNHRFNTNVHGGGKVARYFVSGALNVDNGMLDVDKRNNFNSNISLKQYSLRSNVNINLTKSTEMLVRLNGNFEDYTGPLQGGAQVYNDIMNTNPVLFPPYYKPGPNEQYIKHIMFGNYGEDASYLNPYANMTKGYKEHSRSNMAAQVELKQDLSSLTEGLSFRILANTTRNSFFDVSRQYKPFWYQLSGINPQTGSYILSVLNEETGTEYLDYSEGNKRVSSVFYLESAADYNKTFNSKHSLSGLLVYIMRNELIGNAGSMQESLAYRNLGVSGRTTYGYDSRYFFELNFGYNGSERFYEDKRFGFFPSAGIAWSISDENFWQPYKGKINSLKLRATYGMVGNDAIGSASDRFFYLSEVNMSNSSRGASFGIDRGYSKNGISINRYSNKDITWEISYKSNVALEVGLFDKLSVIAEYFKEDRKNILMTRSSIPATMGLSAAVRANVGEASGEGIDISMDYNQVINRNLWVQGRGNFTYATSKYKVFEEPQYEESYLSRVGYPLSQQWGYIAERLFIDDEDVSNSPIQNFGEYRGGDIKYLDINNDGAITALDRMPIGYPTVPEIIYGFGLSFGFQNFDFSAFLQGSARSSFWIDAAGTHPFINGQRALLKTYAENHWSEEKRNLYALWPRLSTSVVSNNTQTSTWFMHDGSFLRLKQVEGGYTLPRKLTESIRIEKLRVYFSATNLLLWSKFKLWDVEMAGNGLGYPIQKVLNLGLTVSF